MGKPAYKKGKRHVKEPKEFAEEVIQIDRVTRVVSGGRRLRFRATVVIGNRKGKVGVGVGKSNEVAGAIQKAVQKAKKSLVTVNLYGTTIPHEIKIKHKSARILMMPASDGTGIIAGGAVRKVVELAGIKNILSKQFGTNNRLVNSQATVKALGLLTRREGPRKIQKEVKKEDKKPTGKHESKKPAPKKAEQPKKETKETAKKAPEDTKSK